MTHKDGDQAEALPKRSMDYETCVCILGGGCLFLMASFLMLFCCFFLKRELKLSLTIVESCLLQQPTGGALQVCSKVVLRSLEMKTGDSWSIICFYTLFTWHQQFLCSLQCLGGYLKRGFPERKGGLCSWHSSSCWINFWCLHTLAVMSFWVMSQAPTYTELVLAMLPSNRLVWEVKTALGCSSAIFFNNFIYYYRFACFYLKQLLITKAPSSLSPSSSLQSQMNLGFCDPKGRSSSLSEKEMSITGRSTQQAPGPGVKFLARQECLSSEKDVLYLGCTFSAFTATSQRPGPTTCSSAWGKRQTVEPKN